MKTKVTISQNKLDPLHGDYKKELAELATSASNRAAKKHAYDDPRFGPMVDYEFSGTSLPSQAVFHLILPLLGSPGEGVFNYPTYIEIEDVNAFVPAELFGSSSSVIDEETGAELESPLTWDEWRLPRIPTVKVEGRIFLSSAANTGKVPEVSTLSPVFDKLLHISELPKPVEAEVLDPAVVTA